MMEQSGPQTAGPSGPDAGNSSGKPLHGTRAGKRSFYHHPVFRLVLVVGCLVVALPYVLAFAPPVPLGLAKTASQGTAAKTTSPVDETFAAKAPLHETDRLQVVQSSFDPVLVERVDSAGPATAADMLAERWVPGVDPFNLIKMSDEIGRAHV